MTTRAIRALRPDLRRMAVSTSDLRAEASVILEATKPEQWIWSPDRNAWSMALILDHLNSVARLVLPRVEPALVRLRAEGCLSNAVPKYGFGERIYIRLVGPKTPLKVPVPRIFMPNTPAEPAREAGEPFLTFLDALLRCLESANGLDLLKIKIPSPVNERIRFTAGAALEAIVAHNQYHWMQVRALRAHPDFPAQARTIWSIP